FQKSNSLNAQRCIQASLGKRPGLRAWPRGARAGTTLTRLHTLCTEPVYPEYIPPEDDVFLAKEQPLPATASPTAESPRYIPEADRPDVTLPPRKRLSIVHCPGYEVGESSVAAIARSIEGRRADYGFFDSVEAEIRRQRAEDIGYGIRDTWIDPRDVAEEEALTTLEGVNTRVTELAAVQEQDTQDIYEVIEDTQARDAKRTGDDSHTPGTGIRRTERVTRECTYQDFMKCQPLYFKGTEGVVELTQWFERMETVFRISNCLAENQVKFATCTLLAGALTWWNSHVRIIGNDAAYVMTWIKLKKKMADKYCPRNKMKKIETESWNLEVQGTDVTRYNKRFQELPLLCVRTCPEEFDRVERYIGGLPDSIHGSVAASKPKTMQEATEMATGLMDKKIRTYAKRQAANKRKFKDTSRNNQGRHQPPKRQDVVRVYAARSGNRQQSPTNANVANNLRGNGAGQKVTYYDCGAQGHFKRYCPKVKNNNNNRGNQVGTGNAQARVYAVGNARINLFPLS
nr:hypothetical protein [Tanacetum cinerariifolium]